MRRTVAAVLLLGLVAGCSGNAPVEQQQGQWSFKDDRGKEITAPEHPKRVVAQVSAAGALKDYGINVVGTFGPLKRPDGSTDPEAGSVDPSQVADITGPGYGEIDFEKFAALDADLVVAGYRARLVGRVVQRRHRQRSDRCGQGAGRREPLAGRGSGGRDRGGRAGGRRGRRGHVGRPAGQAGGAEAVRGRRPVPAWLDSLPETADSVFYTVNNWLDLVECEQGGESGQVSEVDAVEQVVDTGTAVTEPATEVAPPERRGRTPAGPRSAGGGDEDAARLHRQQRHGAHRPRGARAARGGAGAGAPAQADGLIR